MFSWISFLSYAIVTAATPGPNNIASMSHAARLGLKRSYPFNLGIWTGFSLVMLVCTFLSSTLSAVLPKVKQPMLILGALYMLYLAWQTYKSTLKLEEKHSHSGFWAGFTLQFVNAKIYIYCIVSMEAYILPYYQGQPDRLILFAMLLATLGFLFTLCWALFGSAFRLLFSRYARITNTIMALLLVYCALSLFL